MQAQCVHPRLKKLLEHFRTYYEPVQTVLGLEEDTHLCQGGVNSRERIMATLTVLASLEKQMGQVYYIFSS